MDAKLILLLSLTGSPLALVALHSLVLRVASRQSKNFSAQKVTLFLLCCLNAPLLLVGVLLRKNGFWSGVDLVYLLLVYNLVAYSYFHFFNMSETARRIKILVGIFKSRINFVAGYEDAYHPTDSVLVRLERMTALGLVRRVQTDRYVLKNRPFYWTARILFYVRRLLGFKF
ncbi:hypothetical protein JW992_09540 [candidate division KSB1 bacterium]|nr:hypothetical protein [candidate division KSB1 bacterium]